MNDQPARPDQRLATFAIILIAVGVIFLLGELFNFRLGRNFWPLLVLVSGVALLAVAFGRSKANPGTAVPTAENPPPPPPPVQPTAATPPPAAATPPPPAATQSHFPEDELPHEATSDDAPFPPDEHQPEPPKRRRRTGTRTRKSTPSRTRSKRQG